MNEPLIVIINDQIAGAVSRLRGDRLRFDYDEIYRNRPDATPISVSMPAQIASHPDRVITPWLSGLLPDNDAVLQRWARQFQVSASSPFSMLSSPIGEDCAGAVRFALPEKLDRILKRPGNVTWLNDKDVAQRLRDLRADPTAWLGRTFTGQFSLAGAQAKTALLLEEDRWGVPSGSIPTTHILKPAISGLEDHELNEHICLEAARRCGLLAAKTRVAQFCDESAVVVTRYDRVSQADTVIRIHQEDLCQALGIPPTKKYQNEGGPEPGEIASLLRRIMPPRAADDSIDRFAEALIWNWIIGGTDAHGKNYSLLLAANQVRLAPLYDVASALPYGENEKALCFAMKIGGDYRVYLWRNTWPAAARELGVDLDRLMAMLDKLTIMAPDAFAEAANGDDVRALDRKLPGKLVAAIAERSRRCRSVVGLPKRE
jgi:serine/threonine-protein kinase HipA